MAHEVQIRRSALTTSRRRGKPQPSTVIESPSNATAGRSCRQNHIVEWRLELSAKRTPSIVNRSGPA
jgi:hypothetical protein